MSGINFLQNAVGLVDDLSGVTDAAAARTALGLQPLLPSEVIDVFAFQSDGALNGKTAASGQAWVAYGSPLSVASGSVGQATPTTTGAGYAEVQLSGSVRRIGCTFSLTDTDGAAALVVWKTTFSGGGGVPDSPLHIVCSSTNWGIGTYSSTVFTQHRSGTFPTALSTDGETRYSLDAEIDGDTARVTLPDGRTIIIQQAAIALNAGPYACIESTDGSARFWDVYADSVRSRPVLRNISRDHTRELITAGMAPTVLYYSPTPADNKSIPTTGAIIDATNLTAGYLAPPTGRVHIRASAYISMGGGRLLWAFGSGWTSVITGPFVGQVSGEVVVTGLTPGAPVAWSWQHWLVGGTAGTATMLIDNANGYRASLVVTPF